MALLGLNTPLKIGIFFGYCGLWVASHLLVYGSRKAGAPTYNATSAVLLTELTKLVLACGMYISTDGSFSQLVAASVANPLLLAKYFLPALLYCLYNNLIYINLATFDPGTYNVLMQFRIALTGVIYQLVFSKQLNRNQWLAIILITFGCMVKESSKLQEGFSVALSANLSAWLLLFTQMSCAVFASVSTEVLLKGEVVDDRVTTNLQNAFMYFQSVVCNVGILLVQGSLGEAVSWNNASAVFTPVVLSIIVIMSSVGLVTGFFLKHLDSVRKTIASALEVVITMVVSFFVFGVNIDATSLLSAAIVSSGVLLYSRPVSANLSAAVEVVSKQAGKVPKAIPEAVEMTSSVRNINRKD